MIDNTILWTLGDVLRRFVPLLAVAMALYLGAEGSGRSLYNWVYIVALGGFGTAAYMILNEPAFGWLPVWVTNEVWVIVVLLTILVIEVLLFEAAIALQDLDTPAETLREGCVRLRRLIR